MMTRPRLFGMADHSGCDIVGRDHGRARRTAASPLSVFVVAHQIAAIAIVKVGII